MKDPAHRLASQTRDRALAPAAHGGDVEAVARAYGVSRRDLIDFSANLNALGPPASLLSALAATLGDPYTLGCYPDPRAAPLRDALAVQLGIEASSIVIANGAAALLDAAVRLRPLRRCLVPLPAFSEDQRALAAAAVELVPLRLDPHDGFRLPVEGVARALAAGDADAVLLTNPHNPSGALTRRADMGIVLAAARCRGALAIVDEAFIDFIPQESVAARAAREPDLVVVRSLTKFFAVPGLRAGYAICEPRLAARLQATLPPWPVTSFVLHAFAAALGDEGYARASRLHNERERERCAACFRSLGLRVTPSSANFLLLELPRGALPASAIAAELVRHDRLVVRDCSSFAGLERGAFLRVAVRTRADNERLAAALARILYAGNAQRNANRP